jgi:hypothetical protein
MNSKNVVVINTSTKYQGFQQTKRKLTKETKSNRK